MGVIADFIIGTEPEALEYSRTQAGIPASDVLEAKSITRVEQMRWEPEEARTLIDELAQHALRARRVGKPVYLWNCA
jgi:hypothetical protein